MNQGTALIDRASIDDGRRDVCVAEAKACGEQLALACFPRMRGEHHDDPISEIRSVRDIFYMLTWMCVFLLVRFD